MLLSLNSYMYNEQLIAINWGGDKKQHFIATLRLLWYIRTWVHQFAMSPVIEWSLRLKPSWTIYQIFLFSRKAIYCNSIKPALPFVRNDLLLLVFTVHADYFCLFNSDEIKRNKLYIVTVVRNLWCASLYNNIVISNVKYRWMKRARKPSQRKLDSHQWVYKFQYFIELVS